MTKPLDTPSLQARDIILDICRHRLNLTLTETVCRDLAANAATALLPLLEDLQRGSVASGTIVGAVPVEVTDDPPAVRVTVETYEGGLRVDRPKPDRMCTRTQWCGAREGHEGECVPPF